MNDSLRKDKPLDANDLFGPDFAKKILDAQHAAL